MKFGTGYILKFVSEIILHEGKLNALFIHYIMKTSKEDIYKSALLMLTMELSCWLQSESY
jgi:hypothetical protein